MHSEKPLFPDPNTGFLLAPFGWVAGWLVRALARQPALLPDLLKISQTRMHVIGLALAHTTDWSCGKLPSLLIRQPVRLVIAHALGQSSQGLRRALGKLPPVTLSADGYRRLVTLLNDRDCAKVLTHAEFIDDIDLRTFDEIPVPLRPAAVPIATTYRLNGLLEGLGTLVKCGAAPNLPALVSTLAHNHQPLQLSAAIRQLVETLPLPAALPPRQFDRARRIDSRSEIRLLARTWRNCLDDQYAQAIDDGASALYRWDQPSAPALCLVTRRGRLGWFLDESRGPSNAEISASHAETIKHAFAAAGIAGVEAANSIANILDFGKRAAPTIPASRP